MPVNIVPLVVSVASPSLYYHVHVHCNTRRLRLSERLPGYNREGRFSKTTNRNRQLISRKYMYGKSLLKLHRTATPYCLPRLIHIGTLTAYTYEAAYGHFSPAIGTKYCHMFHTSLKCAFCPTSSKLRAKVKEISIAPMMNTWWGILVE